MAVLVPTAFHERGVISAGGYHFKLAYAGFFLTACVVLLLNGKRTLALLRKPWALAFMAFSAVGFIAAICYSIYPLRSLTITTWTALTILTVPLITLQLLETGNLWFGRILSIFILAQASVIGFDFIAASVGHTSFSLGHVGEIQNAWFGKVARPTAFRGEPGYYAASVLLWCLALRVHLSKESSRWWLCLGSMSWTLGLLSVVLCGSRMGLAGTAATLGLEVTAFVFSRSYFNNVRDYLTGYSGRRLTRLIAVTLLIAMVTLSLVKGRDLYFKFQEKIQTTGTDQTMAIRGYRLVAALEIFKQHPFFGVGPGTSGASFVTSEDSSLRNLMGRFFIDMSDDPVSLSKNPLSHNLYTELLSEWGLFGIAAFFAGLFFLFRQSPYLYSVTTFVILGMIYLSSETVARFDLWLALSTIASFGRKSS